MVTWTKKEFDDTVKELYKDMKKHGWSKTDCVKETKQVMKENNVTIKNK